MRLYAPLRALSAFALLAPIACSSAVSTEASSESSAPVSSASTVKMNLTVVHSDGSPIPWAWIEVDDASGAQRFSGNAQGGQFSVALTTGTYDVKAWNEGSYLGDTQVNLESDLSVEVGEVPSYTLQTEARHSDGSPIAWAWVALYDASGAAVFQGNSPDGVNAMVLLRGTYDVRAFDGATLFEQTQVTLSGDTSLVLSEAPAAPPVDASGFVRASGTGLTLDGQPWHFKGLDIYNANSRNNCWTDLADGSALDDSLDQIGSGQTAFRAWFFQKLAISNGARDWAAFDHTLAVAKAHGQKVIATLENQWQDCDDASFYKTEGWYQSGYTQTQSGDLDAYRDWVHEVVSRYADDPTILAWQLMNEAEDSPSGGENGGSGCSSTAASTLQAFVRDVSGLVKSLDSNHLVNVGTLAGGQCGTGGEGEWQALHAIATVDLCEYHDYTGAGAGGITSDIQSRIAECHAVGKPIFAGEVGLQLSSDRASQGAAKLSAQLGAGDVGMLFWAWDYADSSPSGYDIAAGDPLLDVLTQY